jgi:hypothetical protein
MTAEATRRGIDLYISSNLNQLRDPRALLAAGPTQIIVSVSGFHQHVYERGHAGGDIEQVKTNMVRLADARREVGAATSLKLVFHRYRDNAADEVAMANYATELGYEVHRVWAYVTSVERVMAIQDGEVFEADHALMERLALPFDDALRIVGQKPMTSCYHQTDRLVLDPQGQVMLCCASSGHPSNVVGNFLEEPFAEIEARIFGHSRCTTCMHRGVPNYFLHAETGENGFDELARTRRGQSA